MRISQQFSLIKAPIILFASEASYKIAKLVVQARTAETGEADRPIGNRTQLLEY